MKPSKYSTPCSMSTPAFKLCSVVQTYCLQDKSAQVTEKEEPAGNSVMVVTIPIQCCFHLKVQQEVTMKISFINRVVLLQKIKKKKIQNMHYHKEPRERSLQPPNLCSMLWKNAPNHPMLSECIVPSIWRGMRSTRYRYSSLLYVIKAYILVSHLWYLPYQDSEKVLHFHSFSSHPSTPPWCRTLAIIRLLYWKTNNSVFDTVYIYSL